MRAFPAGASIRFDSSPSISMTDPFDSAELPADPLARNSAEDELSGCLKIGANLASTAGVERREGVSSG